MDNAPRPDDHAASELDDHAASEVAIIGFAGRFPGARNADEFWLNLKNGVESISSFTDEEMLAAGVEPSALNAPEYVRAKAILDEVELFDAAFFDYNPREAEMLDPQHRVLLECAVEAFEHAGYDPSRAASRIGVYAGVSSGSYLHVNLSSHRDLMERVGAYQVDIGNHGEFVPTIISFKLNLRGPSINIQTACSTSLVAVHMACQSLLNGECDMALAGGGSITFPHREGYYYQEEGILSPDGHCRAFDADAQGMVGGEGAALVLLKRLVDAVADGDTIHAVIKGSAVNNDGALKVGFTAPSVNGQAEVITDALALAGAGAETISYIEAHGTGTALGDPIEIAALTQAFSADTQRKGFCAIGSVKTNIGHLDAGAGIAGLIKTTLALKHQLLPPSLHYVRPNPRIDFAGSPFFVNHKLTEWKTDGTPRRAGVSSFGIGGTNAHVILEEAQAAAISGPTRTRQLLLLSAKTNAALDAATTNLAAYLRHHDDASLADVAYTLQVGRGGFGHRRMLVCHEHADAVAALESRDASRLLTRFQEPRHHPVVFMFPGQGAQYVSMARELYRDEPTFREHLDLCAELLAPQLDLDLREVLYPTAAREEQAAHLLNQTRLTQPALFCVEYALAQLWMAWGVRPAAMIGHSIGEYVAACLAGVFSLEDALTLVAARGRLMQGLPDGAMLAVMLSEKELLPHLRQGLSLAAVNAPGSCVASGTSAAVRMLHDDLERRGVQAQLLHTSHAFHSEMMEPIIEAFIAEVRRIRLSPPQTPIIANVTGTWMSGAQATDPAYWARHLRQTVRFAGGLNELLKESERILVEVGPGQTLSTLVRQHPAQLGNQVVLNSLRHPREQHSDTEFLLTTLGRFWLAGGEIDWAGFYQHEQRRRIPLPTYPFERQRYYLEPRAPLAEVTRAQTSSGKLPDIADWFYLPSWKQLDLPRRAKEQKDARTDSWRLIFGDESGIGSTLARQLAEGGENVIMVRAGERFMRAADGIYTLNRRQRNDYEALFKDLKERGRKLAQVVHLWGITADQQLPPGEAGFERAQELGLYSLLSIAPFLADEAFGNALDLVLITDNVQEVSGEETLRPEKATVLGACKVIPQEYAEVKCRTIDVIVAPAGSPARERLGRQLFAELTEAVAAPTVAYRGRHRWAQSFEAVRLEKSAQLSSRLREGGVYLITGGLGDVGSALAEHLARVWKAKLVLIGRNDLPERGSWQRWLDEHGDEDKVSRRIRKVQQLEVANAEVLVLRADVADEQQVREAVAQAVHRFGAIHGVIHGAAYGADSGDHEIAATTPADCLRQFQPKAHGLAVLERVFENSELDFCLVLSSLSSVLGGVTYAAYAAANIFTDTFVRKHNQTHPENWLSINWDGWKFDHHATRSTGMSAAAARLSMSPEEGSEAFERIMSAEGITQVLVSTGDLQARLDRWVAFEASKIHESVESGEASAFHPRPALLTAYVAPSNELEQELAEIWQELLGLQPIGINDNFFELGGHSLLATMVISRLRKEFGVDLPLRGFFEHPTIESLALAVAQHVIEQQDEQSLAQLLGEI